MHVDSVGSGVADPSPKFGIAVIERRVGAERSAAVEVVVTRARDHPGPGANSEEYRGAADMAAAAGDEHRLARQQARVFAQREVRGGRRVGDRHGTNGSTPFGRW